MIVCVCKCILRPENIMFLRQSIWSTNKILKEITVLECEMRKFSKLARSHIHRFPSMLVVCRYTVVYIYLHTTDNKRELHWLYMYANVFGDLKIYMFLRQSIWSTNRILKEIGNRSFRMWKCDNFLSSLARIYI